jgi:hypothetical protein
MKNNSFDLNYRQLLNAGLCESQQTSPVGVTEGKTKQTKKSKSKTNAFCISTLEDISSLKMNW